MALSESKTNNENEKPRKNPRQMAVIKSGKY